LPTLAKMRELNNVKTTIRMITNPTQPIRPFCVNLKITNEYVHKTATPKPLYLRASETFRKLDIDPRKIEKTPHHHRPPWIETKIDRYDFELCSIGRRASDERFHHVSALLWKTSTNTISRSTRMDLRRKIESDTQ
jgi:hypothetical protein